MIGSLRELGDELGTVGVVALGFISATAVFALIAVKPLEERSARLAADLQLRPGRQEEGAWRRVGMAARVDQLEVFYRFFQRSENLDEWLARLYGVASATGVELRAADYRLDTTRPRIARYQITFPIAGTYSELRSFIDKALAELPVLALDQVTFRRKGPNEARVEAEISFTLYLGRNEAGL